MYISNKMNKNELLQNDNRPNKYYRTLNINKKNPKCRSKSNKKIDIKLTKPIKLKNLEKIKNNLQQKTYDNLDKNETKEKEIDAFIEENLDKEIFQPINSNKNNQKIKNQYMKINNKSQNKTIKNIKTQIISNDTNSFSNIRKHSQLINGGNNKNIHGKLNLNITLNNKSPIRLRNINNKKIGYEIDCISTNKKEINSTYIYSKKNMNADLNTNIFNNKELNIINNTINSEGATIISLQEEIENLKKDNLYKEKVINDMKKQLEDFKNEQKKKKSNGTNISPINNDDPLNNEIDNKYHKNTNEDNYNNLYNNNNKMSEKNYKYNNEDESALFDKLKNNYSNNRNLIDELLNENERIKRIINDKSLINGKTKNNNSYQNKKEISLNYMIDKNSKLDFNELSDMQDNKKINNYIEESLKNLNKKFFDLSQNIDCDNIKLMIKMTLNSNFIPEDDIISLFMNNLINYEYIIGVFVTKYMKTNDLLDKEILLNYFKSICFNKNNNFDINCIFNEITSFYDKDIQNLEQIKMNQLLSQKKDIITQIIKECKSIDDSNIGLIEINKFKNILNKNNFFNEFNEDETKLFNILIYNMKKYNNIGQIGLFDLSYYNIIEELGLYDNLLKDNLSENNNSVTFDINDTDKKNNNNFNKIQNEIESEGKLSESIERKIRKKIISNVDFSVDQNNKKNRGSGNSNNTYDLLSSQKYSFDYSSKSGSKETVSLKDGIKELSAKFFENEEYLEKYCKNYVDNLFKICIEDINRKKILSDKNLDFN